MVLVVWQALRGLEPIAHQERLQPLRMLRHKYGTYNSPQPPQSWQALSYYTTFTRFGLGYSQLHLSGLHAVLLNHAKRCISDFPSRRCELTYLLHVWLGGHFVCPILLLCRRFGELHPIYTINLLRLSLRFIIFAHVFTEYIDILR